MKLKILTLTLVVTVVVYFAANYLFIRKHLNKAANNTVNRAVLPYGHSNKLRTETVNSGTNYCFDTTIRAFKVTSTRGCKHETVTAFVGEKY